MGSLISFIAAILGLISFFYGLMNPNLFFICIVPAILAIVSKIFSADSDASYKKERLKNGFKCPNCGEHAGHPISITNKGTSIAFKGLTSNKIGKSYKCEKCKYIW